MTLAIDPLQLALAAVCFAAALAMLRDRYRLDPEAFGDALRRVRAGEIGVRLKPRFWGRDARLVTQFNAALAEIEAGTVDGSHAPAAAKRPVFTKLRKAADPTRSEEGTAFVAVVEVDRFATLRHGIGYRLANQLLAQLARRVSDTIASAEIGRIGRSTIEFAFRARSVGEAQLRLLEAIEALEERLPIDDFAFDLSVSVGFADAGTSSIRDELVDRAAAALVAGQAERVKVCFANDAVLSSDMRADLELMRALPRALRSGEIEMHYQPKLEARSNTIKSAEALVRWSRPDSGLVPTDRFIKVAEETGAIRELTEWVIRRAVGDQKRLLDAGHPLEIYVNISGQILTDREFCARALELVGDACGQIGFEITETAVIGDPDTALANLRAFSDAGIKIAIDDYGSGLSSLAYLKQLPAHELKIDKMFVSGLADSHRDPLLVRSSIDLAHALEMEVTAEGVEDAMALSLLRVMGCDLLQGYFISPPIALAELTRFLEDEAQIARLSSTPGADWARFGTA